MPEGRVDVMVEVDSVFALAVADIVDRKLPLYGDLTRSQRRAGVSDCAIPFIAEEGFPNIVGLAVLRGGQVKLAASFQESVRCHWSQSVVAAVADAVPETPELVGEFLRRMASEVRGEHAGLTMLSDRTFARAIVTAFDSRGVTE
jgi:hypothetical protein